MGDWVSGLSAVSARTTPLVSRCSCQTSRSSRVATMKPAWSRPVVVSAKSWPSLLSCRCSANMSAMFGSARIFPTPPGWGTSIRKWTSKIVSYHFTAASRSVTVSARWCRRDWVTVGMWLLSSVRVGGLEGGGGAWAGGGGGGERRGGAPPAKRRAWHRGGGGGGGRREPVDRLRCRR